jgi:hypothetical protein
MAATARNSNIPGQSTILREMGILDIALLLPRSFPVTPSEEKLEDQAKLFANVVFFVVSASLMLAATLFKPVALDLFGNVVGEHISFIAATLGIFWLASKRPQLALLAIDRQCRKYGHVLEEDSRVCKRCFQTV